MFITRNKLLLDGMKQARKESYSNMSSSSFLRLTEPYDSVPSTVPSKPSSIARPTSFSRFIPTLETISDIPQKSFNEHSTNPQSAVLIPSIPNLENRPTPSSTSHENPTTNTLSVNENQPVSSPVDNQVNRPSKSVHQQHSLGVLPSGTEIHSSAGRMAGHPLKSVGSKPIFKPASGSDSTTSIYSVYEKTCNDMSPRYRSNSLSKRMDSPHAPSPHSYHPTSDRSLTEQRRGKEEWSIPVRTKGQILFKRVLRCFKRERQFFVSHAVCAMVIAIAIGVCFWQLPATSTGVDHRHSVLVLGVLYSVVQGLTSRLWYRRDREVFVREIRRGYASPWMYFGVVTGLDLAVNRVLPSILYVGMERVE